MIAKFPQSKPTLSLLVALVDQLKKRGITTCGKRIVGTAGTPKKYVILGFSFRFVSMSPTSFPRSLFGISPSDSSLKKPSLFSTLVNTGLLN